MKRVRRQQVAAAEPPPPRVLPLVALAVFALALAVRLIHLWQISASPYFPVLLGDARAYDEWAQRLAAGDWIGTDVFYQAPLYPYFLGVLYKVFGRDLTAVRVVQAVLGSISCVLVALAVWRLFSRQAALVAGLGMAIYAPAIFFDGLIQKSVLDVFFVSLAVWLLSGIVIPGAGRTDKSALQPFVLLGVAMGALSLTRENALLLAGVVLVWLIAGGATWKPTAPRARPIAAFIVGLAVVLLPVAARNYAVAGGFYLTTSQFGPNLFIGNNPRSDGTYSALRPGRGSPEYERQDATELAERAVGRRLTPGEVSSYWTDRAMAYITSEPGDWLLLLGRKLLLLVNADEMLDTESQASYAEWSWPLRATGWFAHFGLLVPLAALGVWATWADRRRLAIFYALTLTYAASVVMFYVFARYRFPLVPLLFVFAAPGLIYVSRVAFGSFATSDQLFSTGAGAPPPARAYDDASPRIEDGSSARHGRRRSRIAVSFSLAHTTPVALTVAALVVANWPLLSTSLMQAITENNLAAALHERGRVDEAIAHYERAGALRPDYAPAYSNLGVALRSKGQMNEALAAYEKALSLQPDNPDTHFNLANALLDVNRPQDAAAHFRLAGRQGPARASVDNNLGIALAAEGKVAEAAAAFQRALDAEPDSARAHRNLGEALITLGQADEGMRHLRRAADLDPATASFRYDLAVALLEAGRTPESITEFRAALAIDPAFAPAHNNLGVALGSMGRIGEAIDHFKRALEIQPGYADAQRNLEMATRAR